ncbi:unnamed protein product [Owenia fusiformis]|uniref:Uncharacterized protein n=1 Tax=Owenia fusiformis TaxID=6347 RepID=A0A8J1XRJ3_OWEFU|nr:unnamed protein product [Owenia fusiformis]
MASTEEKDLKAGHLPAEKAGGMRIVQKKKLHPDEKGEPVTAEEEEEYGSPPKAETTHDAKVLISGALTQEEKAYPPEAIKVYHEKPIPVHEKRPNVNQQKHIQQPRKQ